MHVDLASLISPSSPFVRHNVGGHILYSTPGSSRQEELDMIEHIIDGLDQFRSAFPDCSIAITGE